MYRRAIIAITDQCNLHCVHCYNSKNRNKKERTIDWINDSFAQALKKMNVPHIGLTGGEPLLCWDDLINYIRMFKMYEFYVVVTTNGTLLNKKKLEILSLGGVDLIQVSIDGSTPECHNSIRGNGAYEKIISLFSDDSYKDFKLFPMFTICKKNYKEINDFINQMIEFGIKSIGFERYIPSSGQNIEELSLTREMLKTAYSTIFQFEDKIRIHVNDPVYTAYKLSKMNVSSDMIKNLETWKMGCSAGDTSMYIDAIGNIYPCTFSDESFYSLQYGTIEDVPNRPDLCKPKEGTKCAVCKFKLICGGCRATARYVVNGFWGGDDPLCVIN